MIKIPHGFQNAAILILYRIELPYLLHSAYSGIGQLVI